MTVAISHNGALSPYTRGRMRGVRAGIAVSIALLAAQRREYETAAARKERNREGSGHRERRKVAALNHAMVTLEQFMTANLKASEAGQ